MHYKVCVFLLFSALAGCASTPQPPLPTGDTPNSAKIRVFGGTAFTALHKDQACYGKHDSETIIATPSPIININTGSINVERF